MQITKQPRKATATAAATVSASETVFDLETFLLDFVVEVATGGLLSPVFEVKVGATLFLRISWRDEKSRDGGNNNNNSNNNSSNNPSTTRG